jgi:chromosome segregation ATPase
MRDPTTDKDNKILGLTLELDRTKDTVRIQSNQITQKDTEIARLNNDNIRLKIDNDKKGKTITDLNNKMVEKDKQVRNLTDENKKKDVQIKKLTQHVKDKDKTIRDMSKQIKDKNDIIKNQKGKMNKLIKDKKTLVDRTGDLKDKLSTCRNTYQELKLQVGNLASQVLNLKANCGWLADHLWYYASYFGGAVQETGIYPYINAYQFHPNNGIRSAARTKNSGAAFW